MIGLVDCNNFYASCERIFRPDLERKPVAVLSNNDGCIIARSQEVKDLDLPMFKYKKLIEQCGITLFSPNFTLYGDMSDRVMTVLKAEAPLTEVYSVDESFIDISLIPKKGHIKFCHHLQKKLNSGQGIPVSIGIAPTKTLAKAVNKIAKHDKHSGGIY